MEARLMKTLTGLIVLVVGSLVASGQSARLEIDATDLPRKLLYATETIELGGSSAGAREVVLWYPEWVPGSHAPGGPVQNVAGLWFETVGGEALAWRRTPGEVYRLLVEVPAGVSTIRARFRYITNQSSANSHGLDSWGSDALGIVSPNTVLVYPEGVSASAWEVEASVVMPEGWVASAALDEVATDRAHTVRYEAVDMRRLVDTPIMLGAHRKVYELHDGEGFAPHRLHVFSEVGSAVRIDDAVLSRFRRMAEQSAALFGGAPFPSMDILLATTDALPRNGLEHLRTTLNVIPLGKLDAPDHLKGWDRMLVPHEYCHAWCGKSRRPDAMATDDFHTAKGTELLWVYEGLTQYLGELLETRSGMMSEDEYRWTILTRVRSARLQQGRDWRALIDTCAASHTLRGGSASWGDLRRGQDYYMEGALMWMEADAIIREGSDGERSLDDFVRAFLGLGQPSDDPRPYSRDDVIAALRDVYAYDWAGFIEARVDRVGGGGPMSVAPAIGYRIGFTNESPTGPDGARVDALDARDSIGASFGGDGRVRSVQLGSAADAAGLGPDMRVVGVGGYTWSRARFVDALEATPVEGKMTLLVESGDRLVERTIEYDGGPRYMTMERDRDRTDMLAEIVKPR